MGMSGVKKQGERADYGGAGAEAGTGVMNVLLDACRIDA